MTDGHTKERLKELQALPLQRKIGFTAARISEWYQHYNGQVYVSFSGGKDSTVLLDIARTLYPDIKAMFVDTGLEYPEIKEFVKTFDNVDIVRPKMSFKQVITEYGYPVIGKEVAECIYYTRNSKTAYKSTRLAKLSGEHKDKAGNPSRWNFSKYNYLLNAPFSISHRCCDIMKKSPSYTYHRQTGYFPVIATMTSESRLREETWVHQGCNAFNAKHPKSAPMSFWTEQDVLEYIYTKKLRIASVYGDVLQDVKGNFYTTGCNRTGCMFCMFGIKSDKTPNRFQRMKYTHPELYDYCLNKLGIKEVLDFINVPYEPEFDLFNQERN